MTRVLVTGGRGFIGRHLVSALVARGEFVRVYDQADTGEAAGEAEFVHGSILDRDGVQRAFEGVDHVFHLAGIAHLWAPDRADFDRVNRSGTEAVLAAAAGSRIRRLVHCSTEAILMPSDGGRELIDETIALTAADMAGPYTRSKYLAEQAAMAAARSGIPVVVVNPTVPVGPGDWRMTPPSAMLARCLDARLPVSLDFVLNLVDVRDVAEGMILAAEHGRVGERYILGGENMSMKELAAMLEELAGRKPVKFWIPPQLAIAAASLDEWLATNVTHRMPAATTEGVRLALRSRRLDIGKACRELGYAPRPVAAALASAVAWLSENKVNASRWPGAVAAASYLLDNGRSIVNGGARVEPLLPVGRCK